MKKSIVLVFVVIVQVLNIFSKDKILYVSAFDGASLFENADNGSKEILKISYHEPVSINDQEIIDSKWINVKYDKITGWVDVANLKEKLESNIKLLEKFHDNPFAKFKIPFDVKRESLRKHIIKIFGNPSNEETKEIKNKYNDSQTDLSYFLTYKNKYEFLIYHISNEELYNREILEVIMIYTDENELCENLNFNLSKNDICNRFGYPERYENNFFEYNIRDYWGTSIYFSFKDDRLDLIVITNYPD